MVAVTSPVSFIRCCWCSSFSSELQIVSSMLQQMCDGCHSPPSLKKRRGLLFGEERARTGSDSYPGAPAAAAAATVALAESVFKVAPPLPLPHRTRRRRRRRKKVPLANDLQCNLCGTNNRYYIDCAAAALAASAVVGLTTAARSPQQCTTSHFFAAHSLIHFKSRSV